VQKETRIQRKHRRLRIFLNLIMIMSITIILTSFALHSKLFNIENITIKGSKKIPREKILHTIGFNKGENIFRIRIKEAEEKLSKLSYVDEVKIRRIFPREVEIDILERKDRVLIKHISMYYIINEEGYVLRETDSNLEALPIVLGLKTDRIELGENLFSKLELETFEDFIKESHRLDILIKMAIIDMNRVEDMKITLKDGISVAFGPMNNVKYKLRLLKEILDHIEKNQLSVVKILMNRAEHPIIVTDD